MSIWVKVARLMSEEEGIVKHMEERMGCFGGRVGGRTVGGTRGGWMSANTLNAERIGIAGLEGG